jgi:starch synthase
VKLPERRSRLANDKVAIIPWGLILEDFLHPNGLTLDDFCDGFTGSWIFGYVDALRTAGVDSVIVAVSSGVDDVTWRVHSPTGATIVLLPVPRTYRALRKTMRSPHGRTARATFRGPRAVKLPLLPLLFLLKELAPYLATPLRKLAGVLELEACRTVLCQEYEFPRFDICVGLGRVKRIPVFASFQGGDYQRWKIEGLVRPLTVRAAAGLIIPSQTEVTRVETRYRPRAVARIPNPVDLGVWRPYERAHARTELGIPETAPVAAWHGRMELWKKGLDTLLEAWARIAENFEDARLLLVGSGGDAPAVRSDIVRRGLASVVWIDRYLHDRAEIARLLSCADVYLFTSRHEGFPVAPLEAMACGLPVVASDVGGIRDIVSEGEATGGVIVPVDDADRTAEEAVRVLADPGLRSLLSRAALRRSEAFGLEPTGERLASFLLPAASGRP